MRYNVEIYDRTHCRVLANRIATSEAEASKVAKAFIQRIKERYEVVSESCLDISPRGFVFGQRFQTTAGELDVSTAKGGARV